MPDQMIYRYFNHVEIRADAAGDGMMISGLAAPFDIETLIGRSPWGYREIIRRGAFKKTIKEGDPILLWAHNNDYPMARKSTGTLKLRESDEGLEFDATLGKQSWSVDAYESIRRGDVRGMSFGFDVVKEKWPEAMKEEADKLPLRELLEVRLIEISPVTRPAYPTTEVEARAVIESARSRGLIILMESMAHESTTEPGDHSEAGRNDNAETITRRADERARQIQLMDWRLRNGL